MSIYDSHKPAVGEGGGLYLKISDGESVKLRIASEPAIFESLNERDGEKSLSTRYGWLVYNQDSKQPQILQQGVRFFKQVAALAQDEEWGDPTEYDIKVTRQGSGTDTIYTVMPSSSSTSLTPDAQLALEKIDLIEKLAAGPFAQRVMWLSDWDKMAAEAGQSSHSEEIETITAFGDAKRADDTPAKAKARETAENIRTGKKDDVVVEDIGDGEIDLSKIPF